MTAPRRAVVVSAVFPLPVDSGKRMMLNGIVHYLCDRLGPENVHYLLVTSEDPPPGGLPCAVHALPRPRAVEQAGAAVWHSLATGRRTLQESMLSSRRLRRGLGELVTALRPDVEVYDTVRLGQYAHGRVTGGSRILYMDDLFSLRYARILEMPRRERLIDPLGEFAPMVPRPVRPLARNRAVSRALLGFERHLMLRREVEVVRAFDGTVLVNDEEAATLRRRSGVSSVRALPPVWLGRPAGGPARRPVHPPEFVFLGRLNLPHNDDAVRAFLRQCLPDLLAAVPSARLRVVGPAPGADLRTVVCRHPNVVLEGYVEDLDAVFARSTAMVAPVRFGSGVKMKLVEALARGVPLLATPTALEGLSLDRDGADGAVVEPELRRWPDLLVSMADPDANRRLSQAARSAYDRELAQDVVYRRYDAVFGLGPPETGPP